MTAPKPITYDTLLADFQRQDAEREATAASPTTTAILETLVSREVVDDTEDRDA